MKEQGSEQERGEVEYEEEVSAALFSGKQQLLESEETHERRAITELVEVIWETKGYLILEDFLGTLVFSVQLNAQQEIRGF